MTDDAAQDLAARRARRARDLGIEGLGLAGVIAVLYGVASIYPPAAWILGGLVAIALAIVLGSGVLSAANAQDGEG